MKEHGYVQVSMRRFLKKSPGTWQPDSGLCECGLTGALSLGCGGRSYLGRLHTCTPYQITRREVLEEIAGFGQQEDFLAVSHGIELSEEEMRRRYVIKHVLIHPGISGKAYRRAFGRELMVDFPILGEWLERGWLREENWSGEEKAVVEDAGDLLCLTEEGLALSDYIGPMLISEDIREKMQEWERMHGQENHTLQGGSEKL